MRASCAHLCLAGGKGGALPQQQRTAGSGALIMRANLSSCAHALILPGYRHAAPRAPSRRARHGDITLHARHLFSSGMALKGGGRYERGMRRHRRSPSSLNLPL